MHNSYTSQKYKKFFYNIVEKQQTIEDLLKLLLFSYNGKDEFKIQKEYDSLRLEFAKNDYHHGRIFDKEFRETVKAKIDFLTSYSNYKKTKPLYDFNKDLEKKEKQLSHLEDKIKIEEIGKFIKESLDSGKYLVPEIKNQIARYNQMATKGVARYESTNYGNFGAPTLKRDINEIIYKIEKLYQNENIDDIISKEDLKEIEELSPKKDDIEEILIKIKDSKNKKFKELMIQFLINAPFSDPFNSFKRLLPEEKKELSEEERINKIDTLSSFLNMYTLEKFKKNQHQLPSFFEATLKSIIIKKGLLNVDLAFELLEKIKNKDYLSLIKESYQNLLKYYTPEFNKELPSSAIKAILSFDKCYIERDKNNRIISNKDDFYFFTEIFDKVKKEEKIFQYKEIYQILDKYAIIWKTHIEESKETIFNEYLTFKEKTAQNIPSNKPQHQLRINSARKPRTIFIGEKEEKKNEKEIKKESEESKKKFEIKQPTDRSAFRPQNTPRKIGGLTSTERKLYLPFLASDFEYEEFKEEKKPNLKNTPSLSIRPISAKKNSTTEENPKNTYRKLYEENLKKLYAGTVKKPYSKYKD